MAFDPVFHRHHYMLNVIGWSLSTALMRPMRVVVIEILVQNHAQVTFAVDQHSVGALAAYRPDPALGVAVRPWCPRWCLQHRDTYGGEHLIEDGSELSVPIADKEAKRPCSLAEVDQEVAGLLSGPCAGRVTGHAQNVHLSRADLHHEQHVQALQKDRVNMEEIAGQEPFGLRS
nr:hypothetical protein [Nonomuraea diastatica]